MPLPMKRKGLGIVAAPFFSGFWCVLRASLCVWICQDTKSARQSRAERHQEAGTWAGARLAASFMTGGYFDLKPRWASAAFTQSLMDMVSKGTASRPGYFFSK